MNPELYFFFMGRVQALFLELFLPPPSQQSWDQTQPVLEQSPGTTKSGSRSLGQAAGQLSSPPQHVCGLRYFQSLLENAAAGCSLAGSVQVVSSSASGWADPSCGTVIAVVSPALRV